MSTHVSVKKNKRVHKLYVLKINISCSTKQNNAKIKYYLNCNIGYSARYIMIDDVTPIVAVINPQ
jgi:hypothetical protein